MARLFHITLAAIGVIGAVTLYRVTASLSLGLNYLEETLAQAAILFLALAGAAVLCRRRPVMLGVILVSTALVGILLIGAMSATGRKAGQVMIVMWGLAVMLTAFVCLVSVVVSVASVVIRAATRGR